MKVYVVERGCVHEGGVVKAVFKDESKAKARALKLATDEQESMKRHGYAISIDPISDWDASLGIVANYVVGHQYHLVRCMEVEE